MTTTKGKRAALYLRVSTNEQTTENQRLKLEEVASLRDLDIVKVYEDKGISGKHGAEKRPALKLMMKEAAQRVFDVLLVWSVDRLGRSTAQVATTMEELRQAGVSQYYHVQGVDTSTPMGQAMIEMAAVFAKLERSMIVERVNAGLARAKAEGKTLGRPKQITEETTAAVLEDYRSQKSMREIAKAHSLSIGAVHKIIKADNTQSPTQTKGN